jgi:uncharacterized protein YbbC (DUF1343 family)
MKFKRVVACTLPFFLTPLQATETPVSLSSTTTIIAPAPFHTGLDALKKSDFDILKGKQVGLITNHTGVDAQGESTADLLAHAPGVRLIALFSPEHGIRGQKIAGELVGDTIDSRTHLPVYSLYGSTQKPSPIMLNGVDVLVFDLQDVGTRFYTYISTMGLAMEAAAQRGIGFVVLDRPNPLGGTIVEGNKLDPWVRNFTAYFSIPVRHGLTVGELARWYNETAHLHLDLTVIPMTGWTRDMPWSETGRTFIPPSPNIRTVTQALLYSGVGAFEATNVSVGRGTDTPFEWIGAPWIRGAELAQRLNALALPGIQMEAAQFVPQADLYTGQMCSGVRFKVTDAKALRTSDLFIHIAFLLRDLYGRDFQPRWEEMLRVTGTRDFEYAYKTGKPPESLLGSVHKSADHFAEERKPYLLYGS